MRIPKHVKKCQIETLHIYYNCLQLHSSGKLHKVVINRSKKFNQKKSKSINIKRRGIR